MPTQTKQRKHIVISNDLVNKFHAVVGPQGLSSFVSSIMERELKRLQLLKVLSNPEPIWKIEDHPELKNGSAAWIRKMRREGLKRTKRIIKYQEKARE